MSWSLGGYPSINLDIARVFSKQPSPDSHKLLDSLAGDRYGREASSAIVQAWAAFSKAFQEFPFSVGVVYHCPVQYGPSNLLFAKPTGYAATMVGFPYDNLDGWDPPYDRSTFANQFDLLAQGWQQGLEIFTQALPRVSAKRQAQALQDYQLAEAAYLHFTSVANQCHFIILRDQLLQHKLGTSAQRSIVKKIDILLNREIDASARLFALTAANALIGFEASNQYYYVPQDLIEKIINCDWVRKQIYATAMVQ